MQTSNQVSTTQNHRAIQQISQHSATGITQPNRAISNARSNADARFVADMAEEIGTAVLSNSRQRKVKERNASEKEGLSELNDKALALFDQRELADKRKNLSEFFGNSPPSKQDLLNHIQNMPQSDTEVFALLRHIKDWFAPSGTAIAESLQRDLLAENGSAIKADLNVLATAKKFAKKLGNTSEEKLRQLYRTTTQEYDGPFSLFKTIQSQNYGKNLFIKLNFLRNALAADLGSYFCSIDSHALFAIISDLKNIRVLQTICHLCETFQDRISNGKKEASAHKLDTIVSLVLEKTNKDFISSKDIDDLKVTPSTSALQDQVYCAHRMRALISELPSPAFKDDDKRGRLLTEFGVYLDDIIEKEELEEDE